MAMRRATPALLVGTIFICTSLLISLHPPTAATFSRLTRRIFYDSSYQAKLQCDVPHEHLVQDYYSVLLHRGYSLDQHKEYLSADIDLDKQIRYVFWDSFRGTINYYADLDNQGLDIVRRDWGVDLIECVGRPYIDDPVNEDPDL